jgi:uncharacterized membrane protein YfcA
VLARTHCSWCSARESDFAGGLFAIGGALIAIPLLTAVFAFTQHDAQGTAMVTPVVLAYTTFA